MTPVILFRPDSNTEEELKIAEKYFPVYTSRTKIPSNSFIIPRYSALPYYKELETDTITLNSKLINSYKQFSYIANFEYYFDISPYTFRTHFSSEHLPIGKSFVVKGVTNSKKHSWNSLCFAKDKSEAVRIFCELKNDSLIGQQDIIFREYEPLVTFEYLANDLPVTNEFRIFVMFGKPVGFGYYWACAEHPERGKMDVETLKLFNNVNPILRKKNNFYTIDLAQKVDKNWIVVEINSGEMSGLCMVDPDKIYFNIRRLYDQDDCEFPF